MLVHGEGRAIDKRKQALPSAQHAKEAHEVGQRWKTERQHAWWGVTTQRRQAEEVIWENRRTVQSVFLL